MKDVLAQLNKQASLEALALAVVTAPVRSYTEDGIDLGDPDTRYADDVMQTLRSVAIAQGREDEIEGLLKKARRAKKILHNNPDYIRDPKRFLQLF